MERISRRQILLGGAGLSAALLTGKLVNEQLSTGAAGHDRWFQKLVKALNEAGIARPSLVIDYEQTKKNLALVISRIRPDFNYRIVAKSLPSLPLLGWLMDEAKTHRLMLFSEPFVRLVSEAFPHSDILLGKPLPVAAARYFYKHRNLANGFQADRQLQWLVDSKARLLQYAELAEELQQGMRISLEINLGLHRGGLEDKAEASELIALMESHPLLEFSGFMGYEAHIAKAPGSTTRHFQAAMSRYEGYVDAARSVLGHRTDDLTLNAGGSMTYSLYQNQKVAPNELAVGSALLQPTDFDLATLADHKPAFFIATPVLKASSGLRLPGAPGVGGAMGLWSQQYQKSFFIDGGYWKARPVSPPGLSFNPLYGRSSNQELLTGPRYLELDVDDWVFLRPTQSEAVLLEFGDLLVYKASEGKISGSWAPFSRNGLAI